MQTSRDASVERPARSANGILVLLISMALMVVGPVIVAQDPDTALNLVGGVVIGTLGLLLLCGLYSLQTNEAMAILLFGDYRGTDRRTGLRWELFWYPRKKISLRARNITSDKLKVNDKRGNPVGIAGIAIDEARLAHLAYAPEIAGAMLRRRQAEAILSARRLIVRGAVSMVEQALADLSDRGVVDLDEDRKATMVSNLLVVLCGDRDAQPVVNAGTLYG